MLQHCGLGLYSLRQDSVQVHVCLCVCLGVGVCVCPIWRVA